MSAGGVRRVPLDELMAALRASVDRARAAQGPADGRVTTWANGFGVWHARVPRECVSPLIAARRALRDELVPREGPNLSRLVWLHPVRVPELDTGDSVVYREGDPS